MKELIPMNDHGIFADGKDTARVDSRFVAQAFDKEHKHILESIRKITEPKSGLSEEFGRSNFWPSSYLNEQNKKQPCYAMTRDGFILLAMGFTGAKAMQFKEAYIKRFNEMETLIKTIVTTRKEFPLLTANIKLIHDNPQPYHFSNECDMLNKLVIGKTAKQFREEHGIQKGESIRPYLTQEQIEKLETLQKVDVGLLLSVPDYEQRKRTLEWYMCKRYNAPLLPEATA
jgi:Rha family phage regulatory protein